MEVANGLPIYRKGQKEDLGHCRTLSLTSEPGKVMEQILVSAVIWHAEDNWVIRPSQHRFMKGRCYLY